jgi:hypothetical protein
MLEIWPQLPVVIKADQDQGNWDVDNIVAALEHNDRICDMGLHGIPRSQFEGVSAAEKILAAMQQSFPNLKRLDLQPCCEVAPAAPASFLGGSAPHLQTLILSRILFPGLQKLLLSATHLVSLHLWNIPHSGYISPEAMVTCLSVLTSLGYLDIKFESPQYRPEPKIRRLPSSTRTLLPVLHKLDFKGVSKYLEDLVARIDAPLLGDLDITFFHQLIFGTPQLTQFINRTPDFNAYDEARVAFSDGNVSIALVPSNDAWIRLYISCRQSDWQLSSLAQVCGSSFPQSLISPVRDLYIFEEYTRPRWQDDIESNQWIELLRSFTGVKDLYISRKFAPRIAPALQELAGERVTEVLPALRFLYLEGPTPSGPIQDTIEQFIAARQLSGHRIVVSDWEKERDWYFEGRSDIYDTDDMDETDDMDGMDGMDDTDPDMGDIYDAV